jgi:hypothetical protein
MLSVIYAGSNQAAIAASLAARADGIVTVVGNRIQFKSERAADLASILVDAARYNGYRKAHAMRTACNSLLRRVLAASAAVETLGLHNS